MQGIYTYIPEKNHVPKGHNVAAILSLLFMAPITLVLALVPMYFYISTLRNVCAVRNMAVFCSSLTSWFHGMVLTYVLNDFEMVPVAPIITGITLVFTFHIRCISIVRSLYFRLFSAYFWITFISSGIATLSLLVLLLLLLEPFCFNTGNIIHAACYLMWYILTTCVCLLFVTGFVVFTYLCCLCNWPYGYFAIKLIIKS
jgi:hypothetical protein